MTLRNEKPGFAGWSTQISSGSTSGISKGTFSRRMTHFFACWDMTVGSRVGAHAMDGVDTAGVAPRDEQLVPELKMAGTLQPFEKEYFRKDGGRVPVLMGVAAFEDDTNQGVAYVLDLTERKRDAQALRTLETELAHASRLATMGQLAASIAHEINQPIGAARNNAHAALRFLSRDPPDLGEVREALECVVNDTYRASDIIGGIRDQVKKVPPRMESVDFNNAIGK